MAAARGRPRSRARAGARAALQLAAAAALLAVAAPHPAAAQQAGAAGALLAPVLVSNSQQQDLGQCQMTLQYTVNLGAQGTVQPTPIFQGIVSATSNQGPIESWVAGWRFADNATIRSSEDILDNAGGAIQLVNPGSDTPITFSNQSFVTLSFVGNKSPEHAKMRIESSVEPIEEVVFNDLSCHVMPPQVQSTSATSAAPNSSVLEVQYAPAELLNQPVPSNSTIFILQIKNVQNTTAVDLNSLSLRYWMAAPEGLAPWLLGAPWNALAASCIGSSANLPNNGCGGISLSIEPGDPSFPGAEVLLNISLAGAGAGKLRPTGPGASATAILDRNAIERLDLIVSVATISGLPLLNATQDYSYMDTALVSLPTPSQYVSRAAEDNPHVAAFLGDELVWGTPPPIRQGNQTEVALADGSSTPPWVHCRVIRGVSNCLLTVSYCCVGNGTATAMPPEWPPAVAEVSWEPEAALLASEGLLPVSTEPSPAPSPSPGPQQSPQPGGQQQPGGPGSGVAAPAPSPSGGGSSVGLIAGVAVGVVGVIAAIAAGTAAVILTRRRRLRRAASMRKDDTDMGGLAVTVERRSGHSGRSSPHDKLLPLAALADTGSGSTGAGSPFAAASQQGEALSASRRGSARLPTPEHLALLERKASTAPSLFPVVRTPQRWSQMDRPARATSGSDGSGGGGGAFGNTASSRHSSSSSGGSSSSGYGEEDEGSGPPTADVPRRSKSWAGIMQITVSLDSVPLLLRKDRRKGAPLHEIPPITQLPPPVSPHTPPLAEVDLNVDYETEVKPFLGRCLGTGGFGSVYEATWRGRLVAVKKLPQQYTEQLSAALVREIQLTSKFSSDRLVRVYGACTRDRSNVCLIMELMQGGNLFQRIYDHTRRRMSYLEILQLAHDVAAGLAYLHPSVVHRDLKPQNILLDGEGRAKLADFGISRVKDPSKSYLSSGATETGTPMYMAPEQFNGSRVDEKVDVYALGVILNECYTRRSPWRDSSLFFQIILKQTPAPALPPGSFCCALVAINGERPWVDPDCPAPLRKLITRCWHQDPHMRPSPAELMRLTEFLIQEEIRKWELPVPAQRNGSGLLRLGPTPQLRQPPSPLRQPPSLLGQQQQQQQQQASGSAAVVAGAAQAVVAAAAGGSRVLAKIISGQQLEQQEDSSGGGSGS